QTINNHIAIGKWADVFVIAPCTANTINKLAHGVADCILTQTALAYDGIKLIAPAANTNMITSPITKDNMRLLDLGAYKFIDTTSKELACQDIGKGALADVETIFHHTIREIYRDDYWENRTVVLNGGTSIEKIDNVRYITNFSSGKMASSLALAAFYKGANVQYIPFSNVDFKEKGLIPTHFVQNSLKSFEITQSILKDSIKNSPKKPYFFGVAAISDYIPKSPQQGKLKKTDVGEEWNLELKQNIDILASIEAKNIYKIGFKAELDSNNANKYAIKALEEKNLAGICLNILQDKKTNNNFGSDSNSIEFITKGGSKHLAQAPKLELSLQLLDTIKEQNNEK
ncbi:MAG TPA: bifunctional phosphopantothenoylcysteine decarboxylase/phosphopantothenate--cysteine ligase CoaBC, partial [Arcobacter sp.]|nr:bifunctional phosphopantothenoylcysteine decarboxylase/phosphopantothenate--cysteine ligase CoaBC [Arcobacter sp.]